MNTAPIPDLLTKAEAAEFLGIRPRTLDDWREAGAIACIERPGYVRFLRSDLEDFLNRHRRGIRKASVYRPRTPANSQQGKEETDP